MQLPEQLSALAQIIRNDWEKIYFGAVPYLDAMAQLNSIHDAYYEDSAYSVVIYFLGNAQTWRGETAKAVKQHLRAMIKQAV
jgi:hypothetical protein